MPVLEVSVPIAHELLAQCIRQGQALVQRASLVGDFSDYESWKSARNQWIEPTVQALDHMYGGRTRGEEFSDSVTAAGVPQRWQQQYADDLQAVKQAIELLTVLQSELAFVREDPLPAPGATPLTEERWVQAALRAPDDDRDLGAPEPLDEPDAAQAPSPHELRVLDEPDEHESRAQTEQDSTPVGAELAPAPTFVPELAQLTNGDVSSERAGSADTPSAPAAPPPTATMQVLLAHGRNDRWMQAVAHLLEQAGTHDVTILNERSGERATLSEQVGEHAHGSRYAVVLLTADDIGAPRLESENEPYFSPRAHQAVVFEMGFLVAALAPGRVCVLYEDGVQLPCDMEDLAYVRLDMAGTWQPKLLLQLRKAGFDYDLNKLAAA